LLLCSSHLLFGFPTGRSSTSTPHINKFSSTVTGEKEDFCNGSLARTIFLSLFCFPLFLLASFYQKYKKLVSFIVAFIYLILVLLEWVLLKTPSSVTLLASKIIILSALLNESNETYMPQWRGSVMGRAANLDRNRENGHVQLYPTTSTRKRRCTETIFGIIFGCQGSYLGKSLKVFIFTTHILDASRMLQVNLDSLYIRNARLLYGCLQMEWLAILLMCTCA
jgi:hypothetical protein